MQKIAFKFKQIVKIKSKISSSFNFFFLKIKKTKGYKRNKIARFVAFETKNKAQKKKKENMLKALKPFLKRR